MSMFRYYKENQDADGTPLWWPGGPGGFPFRGPQPPQTTQSEYDNLRPMCKSRAKTFYLAKDEDMRLYRFITEKIANQLFILVDRDRQWDADTKDYRIFLEWLEPAYETPPAAPGSPVNVQQRSLLNPRNSPSITLPYSKLAGLQGAGEGW